MDFETFKEELGEVDLHRSYIGYLVSGNSVWDLLSQCFGDSGLVDWTYEDLYEQYKYTSLEYGESVADFKKEYVDYWLGCCDRVEQAQMTHIEG